MQWDDDCLLALVLVCIGIASAGYAAVHGDRLGCIIVVLLGVLWIWINKPIEGDILLKLSETHGITTADLLSLVCFGLAIFGWSRARADKRAIEDPDTRRH